MKAVSSAIVQGSIIIPDAGYISCTGVKAGQATQPGGYSAETSRPNIFHAGFNVENLGIM